MNTRIQSHLEALALSVESLKFAVPVAKVGGGFASKGEGTANEIKRWKKIEIRTSGCMVHRCLMQEAKEKVPIIQC